MANTWTTLLDAVYPVGAVYQSWSSTSPATLFGGTWTQITSKFLYATTSAGITGGSSEHLHSLTSDASHPSWANLDFLWSASSGWVNIGYQSTYSFTTAGAFTPKYSLAFNPTQIQDTTEKKWAGVSLGGETQKSSTTLYPPYITCCMWRRVA